MKTRRIIFQLILIIVNSSFIFGQQVTTLGMGNTKNINVSSSSTATNGQNTLSSIGFLPNQVAASRFLSQATFGSTYTEIQKVATQGIEKWLNDQLEMPNSFKLETYVQSLHQSIVDSLNIKNGVNTYNLNNVFLSNWHFDATWFQGCMTAPDLLRWRVAFALSEIFVTSRVSAFDGNPYALASYYDMLMDNSFGNYRTLIDKITYHPTMGVYLTFLNNHATDNVKQIYPDENYAREIMQLFSIGLYKLNIDGSEQKDVNGNSIPTYNNDDIANLAKVFTGLSWGDGDYLGISSKNYWSYTKRLKFYGLDSSDAKRNPWKTTPRIVDGHERGTKVFLNSTVDPSASRTAMQGEQDIQDALNIIFNHPNVGPFIARRLIQRLVTSNPSPAYIQRIATIFNNNGSGVRGDLKAVIKGILLDPDARNCCGDGTEAVGMLREPFIRYINLVKGLNLQAQGGIYRNAMARVYDKTEQRPLSSNSVFNFFSPDYRPNGVLKDAGKVGPEFQLLSSQTLTGYFNALNDWLINDYTVEYYGLFNNETYKSEQNAKFDLTGDYVLTRNDRIPQLLDKYNLILANGQLSAESLKIIGDAVKSMPYAEDINGVPTTNEASRRVKMTIFLIMTSPDYLISK
ncbi:hypothetical protein EMA8858_01742 [Emticicia aquatica]|uniref:DUF1800 domain-containing protein n=1 Tax=Emticicia aquatica TaxID=1681835 RepID=A0ABN8EV07_9BACT|nr:DUF1800 family protein [Emticicia aquatica]CAH0995618.1 hypothetical protein EMA8858_01742 [Emticicia aquatica]